MNLIAQFRIKRMLTVVLPVVILDIYALYAMFCFDFLRFEANIESMRDSLDMPHALYIPSIAALATCAVLVGFLERDTIFTMLLSAKTVLFASIGYLSWYEWGLQLNGALSRDFFAFQRIFLMRIFMIAANALLFWFIFKDGKAKVSERIVATVILTVLCFVLTELLGGAFADLRRTYRFG